MSSADDFLDAYLQDIEDENFTLEQQEGSNRERKISPDQVAKLMEQTRVNDAVKRREENGRNIFRPVTEY